MKDAWLKLHNLLCRYTREWSVRPDIEVMAYGTDRNVELRLGKRREDYKGPLDIRGEYNWQSTGPRNVSTMRELAAVLLAAADFVDASNPRWAEHETMLDAPESFEVHDD